MLKMKTEKEISKRMDFIENLLYFGDDFLDIKLTVHKRRRYAYELKLLKWVLGIEDKNEN